MEQWTNHCTVRCLWSDQHLVLCAAGLGCFHHTKGKDFPCSITAIDREVYSLCASGNQHRFIPVYFIPLFFQFVRGDSPLEAGVRLLPFVCLAVFGAMINGAIMERYGLYMPWFLAGGLLVVIGGSLLHEIHLDTSTAKVYGYSVITAIGTGFIVQAPFSVAQARVEPELVPEATAFISCGQISGITLSLAIATSIFVNQATNKITSIITGAPRHVVQAMIVGAGTTFFNA